LGFSIFWPKLGNKIFGGKIGRATKKSGRATHISAPPTCKIIFKEFEEKF